MDDLCSTLESVVVGFTAGKHRAGPCRQRLLNARKRRCRVHRTPFLFRLWLRSCSTLESVVVGFTIVRAWSRLAWLAAQRSKASLSGSLEDGGGVPWVKTLLNARKRRCRVHGFDAALPTDDQELLNARKRRCRVHGVADKVIREETAAQRSKASLSGSPRPAKVLDSRDGLLNARKRRCRVHSSMAQVIR